MRFPRSSTTRTPSGKANVTTSANATISDGGEARAAKKSAFLPSKSKRGCARAKDVRTVRCSPATRKARARARCDRPRLASAAVSERAATSAHVARVEAVSQLEHSGRFRERPRAEPAAQGRCRGEDGVAIPDRRGQRSTRRASCGRDRVHARGRGPRARWPEVSPRSSKRGTRVPLTSLARCANRRARVRALPGGTRPREPGARLDHVPGLQPRRVVREQRGWARDLWSGFVMTSVPTCLPLDVYVDDEASPRRVVLSLGKDPCPSA